MVRLELERSIDCRPALQGGCGSSCLDGNSDELAEDSRRQALQPDLFAGDAVDVDVQTEVEELVLEALHVTDERFANGEPRARSCLPNTKRHAGLFLSHGKSSSSPTSGSNSRTQGGGRPRSAGSQACRLAGTTAERCLRSECSLEGPRFRSCRSRASRSPPAPACRNGRATSTSGATRLEEDGLQLFTDEAKAADLPGAAGGRVGGSPTACAPSRSTRSFPTATARRW